MGVHCPCSPTCSHRLFLNKFVSSMLCAEYFILPRRETVAFAELKHVGLQREQELGAKRVSPVLSPRDELVNRWSDNGGV